MVTFHRHLHAQQDTTNRIPTTKELSNRVIKPFGMVWMIKDIEGAVNYVGSEGLMMYNVIALKIDDVNRTYI